MQAIGKNIIVKPAKEDGEKKIGNIFVPENALESLRRGEVISVGNSVYDECDFDIGDIVIFYGTSGIPILFKDENHLIISISDILVKE